MAQPVVGFDVGAGGLAMAELVVFPQMGADSRLQDGRPGCLRCPMTGAGGGEPDTDHDLLKLLFKILLFKKIIPEESDALEKFQ